MFNRMVYVLSNTGTPLMPTERFGKVRKMLQDGRAVVVRREPFTIRLTYDTTDHTRPVDEQKPSDSTKTFYSREKAN